MFADPVQVLKLVQGGFAKARILVVGDVMIDRYLHGEVKRISPEAPVPVVRLTGRHASPGGAANVAMNLAGLGCQTAIAGITGADQGRADLLALLAAAGVDGHALIAVPAIATIVKTRIVAGHQQMLRLDEESTGRFAPEVIDQLTTAALAALSGVQAVILSDYAKGSLTAELCAQLVAAARARKIPVLVDPKGHDWARYRGATSITPNTEELSAVLRVPAANHQALVAGGVRLRSELALDFLTFTRGEHGITLIAQAGIDEIPAQAREVFDVSGAGDTVIATLTAGLASGIPPADAMRLANLAAGIVVGKAGTVPVAKGELLAAVQATIGGAAEGKCRSIDSSSAVVAAWRSQGERVVFTNGCFDIIHAGHVMMLEHSRRLGDRLVVGLNTDASVRRIKGPSRPVNNETDRASVLAALTCVDLVVFFGQDTPLDLIIALRPDVLVKGSDYQKHQVVGAQEVMAWGGEVALVPLLPERSTSATIARLAGTE